MDPSGLNWDCIDCGARVMDGMAQGPVADLRISPSQLVPQPSDTHDGFYIPMTCEELIAWKIHAA
jgi:hypothetical protein